MSYKVLNKQPVAQGFEVIEDSDPFGTTPPAVGTDHGEFTDLDESWEVTQVSVDDQVIDIESTNVMQLGLLQTRIAQAICDAGYTNVDNFALGVSGSGSSVTLALSQKGQATLQYLIINGDEYDLTRS